MKKRSALNYLKLTIAILLIVVFKVNALNHPGMSHKLSDLDRMKAMVQLGKEPWKSSFANLQNNKYASYTYTVTWSLDSTRVVENLASNYEKFKYDALACYYNALEWYITGDVRYAEKSVEILNKMKNIRSIVSSTQALCAGRVLPKLMEGAEIIKSTYSGWKATDIEAFKAMLVYPGYSTKTDHSVDTEHSFYWAMFNGDYARHGNQGLLGMLGTIQIAVFLDNQIMYDRVIRYMKGETHRPDDLPYVSGPTYVNSARNTSSSNSYFDDYSLSSPYFLNTVKDYGYNEVIKNYIWENGQVQEASRDQSHSQLALGVVNNICEIAWNQGDDLYGILDCRPLLGWEYFFKYNLSFYKTFADQPKAWEPTVQTGEFIQRRDRSQRWYSKKINPYNANDTTSITRGTMFSDASYSTSTGTRSPMYEMALGHYKSRLNLPASRYKWLNRADSISKKLFGPERQGFQVDYLGFGTLTFHRPDSCPGDPVTFINKKPVFRMNVAPCVLEAENYDFFAANGQNRTFLKLSNSTKANDYRPDSSVTILPISDNQYKVSDIADGEWLSYTVFVPEYSKYSISINYNAKNSNGKVKLKIGKLDKTSEIVLPITNEGEFVDYKLFTDTLLSGVRSLRIFISGESNSLELNSIKIEKAMIPAKNDFVSYQSGDYNLSSNWRLSDGNGGLQVTIPSAAPTTTNNVWIQSGISMNAVSANVNAKNLCIAGELIVGSGTSIPRNITLGTSSLPGSLYVLENGILKSTTNSGVSAGLINVYGNVISNYGRIGSEDSSNIAESGLRFICFNPSTTTFTGNGKTNIAGVQIGSGILTNQEIIIDADINFTNTNSSAQTLSLLNGNSETASKTITINEGRIVNFTGGNSCLLHQQGSGGAQTSTSGDFTYNILGTLNTGDGGLYLTTANLSTCQTQRLSINVGNKGKLIVGSKFILNKPYSTQEINFNFGKGSAVQYSGSTPTTFLSTSINGNQPQFPASYSSLIVDNPFGLHLTNNIEVDSVLKFENGKLFLGKNQIGFKLNSTIESATDSSYIVTNGTGMISIRVNSNELKKIPMGSSAKNYEPITIQPVDSVTFQVKSDSVFSRLPLNIELTNTTSWKFNTASSIKAIFTFQPSKLVSVISPVVGYLNELNWNESDAVFDGIKFAYSGKIRKEFGTGSKTGFGLWVGNNEIINPDLKFKLNHRLLEIIGLSNENSVKIFNVQGQQISEGFTTFLFPSSGIYLLKIKTNGENTVIKLYVD